MKQLLVYGSLRRGQQAHGKIEDLPFLGEVRVPGFDMYQLGWFPGIRRNAQNEEGIVGELYQLPEEAHVRDGVIQHLDYYEGYFPHNIENSLFVQEEIDVNNTPTLVYVYNRSPGFISVKVKDGDWVAHKGENNQ